jgi:hypothetical protein
MAQFSNNVPAGDQQKHPRLVKFPPDRQHFSLYSETETHFTFKMRPNISATVQTGCACANNLNHFD